jgi:hypothetical protein
LWFQYSPRSQDLYCTMSYVAILKYAKFFPYRL